MTCPPAVPRLVLLLLLLGTVMLSFPTISNAAWQWESSIGYNNCPVDYKWFDGQCYTLAEARMTFDDAASYCQYHKASLPLITTWAEYNFVTWLTPSDGEAPFVWLGVRTRGWREPEVDSPFREFHQYQSHRNKGHGVLFRVHIDSPCNFSSPLTHCRLAMVKNLLTGEGLVAQHGSNMMFYTVCVIEEPQTRPFVEKGAASNANVGPVVGSRLLDRWQELGYREMVDTRDPWGLPETTDY